MRHRPYIWQFDDGDNDAHVIDFCLMDGVMERDTALKVMPSIFVGTYKTNRAQHSGVIVTRSGATLTGATDNAVDLIVNGIPFRLSQQGEIPCLH